MVEEIFPDLHRIEIPLPNNPLKALNSYVIKAPGRNLIVDTGMNREECKRAMYSGLGELSVDLQKTDFFITHFHADHSGLVSILPTDTSVVYFNQPDADFLSSSVSHWENVRHFAYQYGFPEKELQEALEKHPGNVYSAKGQLHFSILKEGDTINIGCYLFKCVETPGHTGGHMCLYEPEKKILISGDHILSDITPNISLWSAEKNPLKEYLASLDKIYDFDIEIVLPGHRNIFRNSKERIRELQKHHQVRAEEVLSILEKGGMNAYQVASRMSWEMTYEFWDLFPAAQKWFATGEAIAHLKYLEEKGVIRKKVQGQKILFSLSEKETVDKYRDQERNDKAILEKDE